MTFLTWSMSLADSRSLCDKEGIKTGSEHCRAARDTDLCWNTRNYKLTFLEFLHQRKSGAGGRTGFCWTWAYFSVMEKKKKKTCNSNVRTKFNCKCHITKIQENGIASSREEQWWICNTAELFSGLDRACWRAVRWLRSQAQLVRVL